MKVLKQAGRIIADFFEMWLPGAVFLAMFVAFLFNIIMRYIFNDAQNWVMEFSINGFVIVGLLGACMAQREGDLVVFDLLYERLPAKAQTILRIVSNVLIVIGLAIATPYAIKYIISLPALTPVLKIPQSIVFAALPILFISAIIRCSYFIFLDVKSIKDKSYAQKYYQEKESLV